MDTGVQEGGRESVGDAVVKEKFYSLSVVSSHLQFVLDVSLGCRRSALGCIKPAFPSSGFSLVN